jgi:hypothetical protein
MIRTPSKNTSSSYTHCCDGYVYFANQVIEVCEQCGAARVGVMPPQLQTTQILNDLSSAHQTLILDMRERLGPLGST